MQRFKNILFVYDDLSQARSALIRVAQLVKRNSAKLTIFHVIKDLPNKWDLFDNLRQQIQQQIFQELNELSKQKPIELSVEEIDVVIEQGEPFIQIIRKVLQDNHDMVFKSAAKNTKKSMYGFLTLDMHLLRKCPCPIWLYRENKNTNKQLKLLAAIDPDRQNSEEDVLTKTILELALSLRVRESSAYLDILHCWDAPYENTLKNNPSLRVSEEELISYVEGVKHDHLNAFDQILSKFNVDDVNIQLHFEKSNPKQYIPEFVEKQQIDILIMGTVGRTGISGLLIGNTAEEVLGQVDCSVLAIKPKGFKTPVI